MMPAYTTRLPLLPAPTSSPSQDKALARWSGLRSRSSSDPQPLNAQLAVGTVNTQVVVNTDVPLMNTESGSIALTLNSETLGEAATGKLDRAGLVRLRYSSARGRRRSRGKPGSRRCRYLQWHHAGSERQPALQHGTRRWSGNHSAGERELRYHGPGGYSGGTDQQLRLFCPVRRGRHYVQPDQQGRLRSLSWFGIRVFPKHST